MSDAGTTKPDADRLWQLLAGKLSADEEARLLAEIERDETAQHRLEEIAADPQFRGDVRDYLGRRSPSDSAVQQVVNSLTDGLPEPEPPSLDFLEPTDSDEDLGRFDGYRVVECVGSGGMGIVLKAFDPTLNRIVALKVLSPLMATSVNARQRFLREARAAAAVSHDHIITIHAVGEWNGLPYLVMEFIRGLSLQQKINTKSPLELAEILRIGMQTASGLSAAHAQGLIHRDVKPENILLENSVERVKLTDFGLARTVDDSGITRSGMMVGTPEYMAPEQAQGEPPDARADLFSLGSVLYAMCTGVSPFRADSLAGTVRRVCDETPRPIWEVNPEIPDWLVSIITKLHAKSPDERYQSADEVADILTDFLAALRQGTVPTNRLPKSRSTGRSRFLPLLLLGGVVLLIAVTLSRKWLLNRSTGRLTGTATVSARTAPADHTGSATAHTAFNKRITLQRPYASSYAGAPTDKLSVQYAVIAICEQIGIAYQWDKSQANTEPLNRRWIRPHFVDVPARQALTEILRPMGLTFETDESGLYLQRAAQGTTLLSTQHERN